MVVGLSTRWQPKVGGLSLMVKIWARVSLSEQRRGRRGMRWAPFIPIHELMQQAHNPAYALLASGTPPLG